MNRFVLGSVGAVALAGSLLAVPQAANAQYGAVGPAYGYGLAYGAPPPPRHAGYYALPPAGGLYSPFPYAMQHELRIINGMVCRTIYEPGVGRIPVACAR